MSLAELARRTAKFAIDNSPTILTTIGVVGTVTTAYLAGKASFEAADIIRAKEETEGFSEEPKERVKEQVQLVWKLYIPTVTMGAATLTCIIGANRIGTRRAASIAAAYAIVEKTAEEYRAKVIETVGERKEELMRASIVQDRVNESWTDDDSIVIHGKVDGEVCYDKFSDRYVWNTEEGLRSLVNDLNQTILHQGYATVGDLYYLLDMPAPSWSHEIGWNSDGHLMQLRFSSVLTPSGKPVKAFEFDTEPVHNYKRFH